MFIKGLGKFLCFGKRIEHLSEIKRASRRIRLRKSQKEINRQDARVENGDVTDLLVPTTSSAPEAYPTQTSNSLNRQASFEHPVLVVMSRKLSLIESKLQTNTEDVCEMPDVTAPVDVRLEWRLLSLVLDRLFFLLFFIIDCVSFAAFHPQYKD